MPVMSVMSVMPSTHGVEFRIDQFTHFIPSLRGHLVNHTGGSLFLSVMEITAQGAPTGASAGSARPKRSAFAEFETALRKERQAEGIAKAKAGIYKGRPVTIKAETIAEVKRLKHEEKRGATYIAKALNISRVSVYRALAT